MIPTLDRVASRQRPETFSDDIDYLIDWLTRFVPAANMLEQSLLASATTGTSTTNCTITTAVMIMATQSGKSWAPGMWLYFIYPSDTAKYMIGQVVAYDGGLLTVNMVATSGSGTYANWTIGLALPGLDAYLSTAYLRANSSGNLAQGVSTSSPWPLDIRAFEQRQHGFGIASNGSSQWILSNLYHDGDYWRHGTNGACQLIACDSSSGAIDFYRAGGGSAGDVASLLLTQRWDNAGNSGLNVVPSSWGPMCKVHQVNQAAFGSVSGVVAMVTGNAYNDGAHWRYIGAGAACLMYVNNSGQYYWYIAASGTADAEITWVQAMVLDNAGSLSVAGSLSAANKVLAGANASASNEVPRFGQVYGGYGQAMQYVTGSRALGVTYTNSTGRPIDVFVTAYIGNGSGSLPYLQAVSGGAQVDFQPLGDWNGSNYAGLNATVTFTVAPGDSYYVTGVNGSPTLSTWVEYR